MRHVTTDAFRDCLDRLPASVQKVALKNIELLKANPSHPSLHLKKVGRYWSVRLGRSYRALGVGQDDGTTVWFWAGNHDDYDKLIRD